jgi:hypothetical protein
LDAVPNPHRVSDVRSVLLAIERKNVRYRDLIGMTGAVRLPLLPREEFEEFAISELAVICAR